MDRRARLRRLAVLLFVAIGALGVILVWRSSQPQIELPLPSFVAGSMVPEPPGTRALIAAGDISECDSNGDEATARVVDGLAGTVAALGDLAYDSGSPSQFANCYGPTWGRFADRTRPVPGNHDYVTQGASGYFGYFGPRVGRLGESWYAYDLGSWRVYALDSNCAFIGGCGPGSPQLEWLLADLAANPRSCVLAYWHHPRYSSGQHGNNPEVQPLWAALVGAGADVVLASHDHLYERFARLDASGADDPDRGIRSFVVGTGGKDPYEFRSVQPGSEVRNAGTYGVLVLTLRGDGYDWRFVPVAGSTFTDSGSEACR